MACNTGNTHMDKHTYTVLHKLKDKTHYLQTE